LRHATQVHVGHPFAALVEGDSMSSGDRHF
jgi:hypothetical protein